MSLAYPDIDPIIISFGPLAVSWYSLSYVCGILLGWVYIRHLNDKYKSGVQVKIIDDTISWAILGIVVGGRLGYVIFYGLEYYLHNPTEIFRTWHGGMSFHGGLIGMICATYLMSKYKKIPFWPIMDLIACAAPIGLFLGRIANFIGRGLYGRVTDVPWAMIFPDGGPYPRHPSQLYESFFEGLVLFVLLFFFYKRFYKKPAFVSGLFLIFYGCFRFIIEFFRQPDEHMGFIFDIITMGQLLSIPMVVMGIILILYTCKRSSYGNK
jgi:phosphatidylglycerol---prolipoprotein diacylglyceryl transferase